MVKLGIWVLGKQNHSGALHLPCRSVKKDRLAEVLVNFSILDQIFFHFWSAVWQCFITTSELLTGQVSMLTHSLWKSFAILSKWPWQMGTVQFLPMLRRQCLGRTATPHFWPKINFYFSKNHFLAFINRFFIQLSEQEKSWRKVASCLQLVDPSWPALMSSAILIQFDLIPFFSLKSGSNWNRSIVRITDRLVTYNRTDWMGQPITDFYRVLVSWSANHEKGVVATLFGIWRLFIKHIFLQLSFLWLKYGNAWHSMVKLLVGGQNMG